MKFLNNKPCLTLALSLFACTAVYAQIRVVAQVDNSQPLYIGKRFVYSVIIDGDKQPGQVDTSALAPYDPQSAGTRDLSQTSVQIYNGRRTVNEVKRLVMNYTLLVKSPGTITLPSIPVIVNKKTYRTNPVEVTVLKPGTTDKLDLKVTLSDTTCYVGQPVIMTAHFYVAANTDVKDFSIDIPGFDADRFILDDPVVPNGAKQYQITSGLPVYVTQTNVLHKNRQCFDVALSKVLIPKGPGVHNLGQTSVSASLAVGRTRSNDPFENMGFGSRIRHAQFMVTAPALDLNVRPLPINKQPANFSGLVGRYAIKASASPVQVDVGQAITLTLQIGGNAYLNPVQWPDLEANEELASHFAIPPERSAPIVEKGFKVFTQTLRANSHDVTRIPPIELSYFDPDKGDYAVAKTHPIALDVAETKTLTAQDIEGRLNTPINRQIQAIQEGLSTNTQDQGALVNQRFTLLGSALSPMLAPIWCLPLMALLISVTTKIITHTNPTKIAHKRRQHAASRAIKLLRTWQAIAVDHQNEHVALALKQFMGERFDRTGAALTAEDCFQILKDHEQDTALAGEYKTVLTQCEASQYAPMRLDVDQKTVDHAIKLIQSIHKQVKL
jgi:hypothetical protein